MSQTPNIAAAAVRKPSLRERLVLRIMVPLTLTWVIGSGLAIGVAYFFAQKAFDRSLLDDAYVVASHVKSREGELYLELNAMEMSTVLFDQSEKVFFTVLRPDGSVVAGHPGLRATAPANAGRIFFTELTHQGQDLRGVVLKLSEPGDFSVVVALTQGSRSALLNTLIVYSVTPQILILILLGAWLRLTIGRELQPLSQLQTGVNQRDAHDLTPVAVASPSSDVDELALAINDLLARVGHSMRAQREFSGNVAHELRTPLAGIRALAEYGLAHNDAEIRRQQLLRIGQSEARASRLVEQLLALALAEESGPSIPMEGVALDEVVQATVLRYLARSDAAGVDLGVQGLGQPVRVLGTVSMVEGILTNLIDNALRYGRSPDGQLSSVTVQLTQHAQSVMLSVIDNGPGLSLDERRRLSKRGVRGVTADRLGQGAGLGLAIVAKFAQVMGARFELGSPQTGQGLRASVIFQT
jgi:two-component system sensor histidine kinase TctE